MERAAQYRRGFDNNGIPLVEELDIPMWSQVTLTTVKPVLFFGAGGGPSAATSLQTANIIDMNKDFDVKRIEFNILKTAKTALVAADLDLIGKLIFDTWLEIYTNQTKRSWYSSLAAIIKYPMAVAAAGAMAYDPTNIVNGGAYINVPKGLVIKGGEAFTVKLNNETTADDFTGLTAEVVLWGRLYASERAQVG